jgi:hypothetical protein
VVPRPFDYGKCRLLLPPPATPIPADSDQDHYHADKMVSAAPLTPEIRYYRY